MDFRAHAYSDWVAFNKLRLLGEISLLLLGLQANVLLRVVASMYRVGAPLLRSKGSWGDRAFRFAVTRVLG